MPVFQRSKFLISLASLPLSCLFVGSCLAQVDTAKDALSPVFENLPKIDVDSLPVPPRHLPAFRGSELNPSANENPFADQFRQAYGDQIEQPSASSTLKNWKQAVERSKLELSQTLKDVPWTAPVTPGQADAGNSALEQIRVAKADTVFPKTSASLPQLEPTNGFTLPIMNPSESSQTPQATVGELVPNGLDLVSPGNEAVIEIPKIPQALQEEQTQVPEVIVPAEIMPETPSVPVSPDTSRDNNDFWDDQNEPSAVNPLPIENLPAMNAQTELGTPPPTYEPAAEESFAAEPAPRMANLPSNESLLWWKNKIQTATIPGGTLQSVETNGLVFFMLQRSPRLRAVSQNPLIREQRISEAQAEFDPVSFLRSQWQDRVDPVGDTLSLTNDNTNFLDDHIWTADMGIRRKTTTGATAELNQRLGFRNSNSQFFNPQDQGTAALSLNVTQPLMRGRGKYFNQSQILIAQAATNASWDTLSIELQDEIQSVIDAYWRLYFDRCVYLQKQMNVVRAQGILEKLEGRAELDSLPNQIARARSAVLSRKTELANARRDIRNSETDIRRLTANSDWATSQMVELLPMEMPDLDIPLADLEHVITTAISNRPEIRETLKRSKIAAIQRDISVNELMPELSLLFGTYVSALQGQSQLGDAFIDQFGSVKPGYSVGVEFEMPIRNRAARSRLTQRKLQMTLIKAEIEETLQNVIAESQIARRRVASAKETLVAATEAIRAARLDLEQIEGRWESFALIEGDIAEGQTPTIVLDQLLDSQTRLVEAESVHTQAEMELKISEIALQRTMGTLLTHQSVDYSRGDAEGMPTVDFSVAQ